MAEISMTGNIVRYEIENLLKEEYTWGLDGWSENGLFYLALSVDDQHVPSALNEEQCSMLLSALVEHMKEVKDAQKENIS